MWLFYAIGSSFFAGITAILVKIGVENTDSHLLTALRTIVVLIFSWIMAFIVGSQDTLWEVSPRTLLFLGISGVTTGASWICYFHALQIGDVNKVVPIDKSSIILTILLGVIFLGEPMDFQKAICVMLIAAGTFLMIEKKKNENEKKKDENGEKAQDQKAEERMREEEYMQEEYMQEECMQKENGQQDHNTKTAVIYAMLSAVFASLTAILSKVGIVGIESNLGTAIRTIVVLFMAWLIVLVQGKQEQIRDISRKNWIFIILSGVATGMSWLCYYRALQDGPVSVIQPIDKLSILVSVIFAYIVLGERLTRKSVAGLVMIVAGTLGMVIL